MQGSAHRVGAWVKLIQKDMRVATGKLAGDDPKCETANLDRGGSLERKDAGYSARFKRSIPLRAPTKLVSVPLLPCWVMVGTKGGRELQ